MQPPTKIDFALLARKHCSQSKCKAILPEEYQYKTCDKCRAASKMSMQKKRKRDKTDEGKDEGRPHPSGPPSSEGDTELKPEVSRTISGLKEH
jgi:hypothetical protein